MLVLEKNVKKPFKKKVVNKNNNRKVLPLTVTIQELVDAKKEKEKNKDA